MKRAPSIFIGHGSPMNAIAENPFAPQWAALGKRLGAPRAIVCISAHWETDTTELCALAQPKTIHDFYGFPSALHAVQYPAPGDPALAQRIANLIGGSAKTTQQWGLDHGAWQVLVHMYPGANVPGLQLSLARELSNEQHVLIGETLCALRDEGVMILASGNIVHNLSRVGKDTPDWAREFDAYVRDAIARNDRDALAHYERAGTSARIAVPTAEHYLPLLYAIGASDASDRMSFFSEGFDWGSISMRSVVYE
jgi:4,5-DOPA dioxygenase extradiol